MSFCKNCGKELHGQEQCNCQRQVSFSPKKRVLSVVVIVIAALVVCIIALFTLFLSGYKKPINNLLKGIQNCDKDKFCSAFTDEEIYYFSDKFDEFDKDFNGFIDDKFNEILEANYGVSSIIKHTENRQKECTGIRQKVYRISPGSVQASRL